MTQRSERAAGCSGMVCLAAARDEGQQKYFGHISAVGFQVWGVSGFFFVCLFVFFCDFVVVGLSVCFCGGDAFVLLFVRRYWSQVEWQRWWGCPLCNQRARTPWWSEKDLQVTLILESEGTNARLFIPLTSGINCDSDRPACHCHPRDSSVAFMLLMWCCLLKPDSMSCLACSSLAFICVEAGFLASRCWPCKKLVLSHVSGAKRLLVLITVRGRISLQRASCRWLYDVIRVAGPLHPAAVVYRLYWVVGNLPWPSGEGKSVGFCLFFPSSSSVAE